MGPGPIGAASQPGLFGFQVLVVEDEALVAMNLEDMLADFGCVVSGVACTLSEALAEAKDVEIDAAILDVNLGGQMVYPVADLLTRRGIPFVFSTAYGSSELLDRYPQARLLQKPYQPGALAQVLIDFARRPLH